MFLEYYQPWINKMGPLQKRVLFRQDAYSYMVCLESPHSFMRTQVSNWILLVAQMTLSSSHKRVPYSGHAEFFPLKNKGWVGEDHTTEFLCDWPLWKIWHWPTDLYSGSYGFFTSYFQHMLQGVRITWCKDCTNVIVSSEILHLQAVAFNYLFNR